MNYIGKAALTKELVIFVEVQFKFHNYSFLLIIVLHSYTTFVHISKHACILRIYAQNYHGIN